MIGGGFDLEDRPYVRSTRQVVSDLEEKNLILSSRVREMESKLSKIEDCFSKDGTPEQKLLKCLKEAIQKPETEGEKHNRRESLRVKALQLGPLIFDNEKRAKERAEELTKILNHPFEARLDSWEGRWVVAPR